MVNGTFLAVAALLEKQTKRLDTQARLRERVKAAAVEMARRAQVAQAEARQATLNASESSSSSGSGGGGGEGGDAARAVAATAAEAARAASQAAEAAAAEARRLAAEKGAERWLGAEALSTLLSALLECRMVMEGGAAWTAPPGGRVVRPNDSRGSGDDDDVPLSSPLQVTQRTCKAIMMQIGVLSEEELKKESPDVSQVWSKCKFQLGSEQNVWCLSYAYVWCRCISSKCCPVRLCLVVAWYDTYCGGFVRPCVCVCVCCARAGALMAARVLLSLTKI